MTKKKGINLDTAFNNFWQPPEVGATMYRFKNGNLYNIDYAIKDLARYAFYQGWAARGKRDKKAGK